MDKKPTYNELELRIKELEKELRDAKQSDKMLREAENIEELLKFVPFCVFLILFLNSYTSPGGQKRHEYWITTSKMSKR